jgi:metallo-beta-lactamase family protein
MKIKFLGAAGTVTGSSYVLTSDSGQAILIDLGMFQGLPTIEDLNYLPYDYDCSQLSAALLTHAHLDHCGRLPILLSLGFTGDIWMTPATRDLTELSLLDSAKIAKQDDKKYLYDKELVLETLKHCKTVEYRTPVQIGDFSITWRDAGHILGSASLEITDTRATGEIKKIVFSGDLGNSPEDLVEPTELIAEADAVVMESTYGDELHPTLDPADTLQAEIKAVEQSGGTLLIPCFSLERTQEILHILMHLKQQHKVSAEIPVFLDSPMAEKATEIYLKYPQLFNAHLKADLKQGVPFNFAGLSIITSREAGEAISRYSGGKVILAGSGMMTGGKIVHHAAQYLPIPTTRLLIVGYQGEETLGRKLLEGAKEVIINKITVPVRATVSVTRSMSSHADQAQLTGWLKNIRKVKKVFLTHGEDEARTVLAQEIRTKLGITDITLPKLNDELSV